MRFTKTLIAAGFAAAALAANAFPGGPGGANCGPGTAQACGAGGPGAWGGRGAHMLERIKAADTNADGFISRSEAAALPRLAENFDTLDANKDGQVSFAELEAHRAERIAQHQSRRAEHFKQLDTNGDGQLSRAEAESGAPGLAARFDAIDANKDGQLSTEELSAARGRGRQGRL